MSEKGVVPWIYEEDPESRHVLASEVLGEMQSLARHPGWKRIMDTIDQKITAGRDSMEATGRDIELKRGALKALREIRGITDFAIERADAELSKHRGE